MFFRPIYVVAGIFVAIGTVAVFVLLWQKSGFLLYMTGLALATYAAITGETPDDD